MQRPFPRFDQWESAVFRTETLLASISRESRIIEIGPSYNPLAPRASGWNTTTVDHLTREGLVAKYRGAGVDISKIEEVDIVWSGGSLSDVVPKDPLGAFDVFIASHVIEHTPDLVGFLKSAETILNSSGLVILAIPDKRYCFDFFQPITTTGEVLTAHAEGRSRHTPRLGYDHYAYSVASGQQIAWGHHPLTSLRFASDLSEAIAVFKTLESSREYIDMHAWRFTPSSFQLLLLELARLDVLDWRVERIVESNGCEFYARLRRGAKVEALALDPAELASRRMGLLKQSVLEVQTQIDWLLAGDRGTADELSPDRALSLAALLRREVNRSHGELDAMRNSTSWRLTAPLRVISRWLRFSVKVIIGNT